MAFNTINNSEFQRKLYVGYTPVKVLAVNPTKEELEKYFGPQQNEPNYMGNAVVNGKDVPQVRIEFILEAKKPGTNDNFYLRLSFFLNKGYATNKLNTKVQVIDTYGRKTWVTNDDAANHRIPVFGNGQQARIDKNYRPLIIGEDRLIMFIRALFCLNDPEKWDPNVNGYVARVGEDLARCEGILDNTKDFFKGDLTELKNAIKMAENNTVYVMLGVRTGNDGRQFQTVYNSMFVRKNRKADSVARDFEKALNDFYPNDSEFKAVPLQEFTVAPTNFGELKPADETDDMPEAPMPNNVVDDMPFDSDWN